MLCTQSKPEGPPFYTVQKQRNNTHKLSACTKYSPARHQMSVNILTDELKTAATSSSTAIWIFYLFIYFYLFFIIYFFSSNLQLRIIHARISNNLNKEFIMMTKFTIHVQRQCSFVFKNSRLSYFARLRSRQIIVLVCRTITVPMKSVS